MQTAARWGERVWEAPWHLFLMFFFFLSFSFSVHIALFFFLCPGIWKNRRTRYEEGAVLLHTTDPGNCCQMIYNQRLFNIQELELRIIMDLNVNVREMAKRGGYEQNILRCNLWESVAKIKLNHQLLTLFSCWTIYKTLKQETLIWEATLHKLLNIFCLTNVFFTCFYIVYKNKTK